MSEENEPQLEPEESEKPVNNEEKPIDLNKIEETAYGKIAPRILEQEMKESYLDYAMSVIVARALPDVRDGLKPVHRRVLYSMHELGLGSRGKFRKSATVVGDVLGKYHPHGDVAVYDTLVRMAQKFSMRYRLVDGQGNFGSMDGDSAAAMRYTEAKMTAMSEEMLADIEKDTVNFIPNYDGTREEPQVLPAKVPQLLLNGSLGIAVGMATNIPPHNLGEICDGVTHLIDNPEASVDDLMEFVKGPDFPTGASIYNVEDIKMAYATGKGRIDIRAVANIEEAKRGFRILITEIPYQVNKADLISKIAELVKEKKIEGISDLRDESDRKEGVRIVVELKNNAYPKKILNLLYEHTNMQTAFHVNMLALVDGLQPRVLTLKNVLEEYIKHRQVVVRRRTEFELKRAKDRAHILEGLKKALDHIDEIIATIKKSETKEIAHKNLMAKFSFSEKQATAILEMRLSALAGLERKKIEDELKSIMELIKKLETILASKEKILGIIKEELEQVKEKFADERRTKIYKQKLGEFSAEDLIPDEQVIVTLTRGNYIKRVPIATFRSQGRGGKGVIGMETKEEDVVDHMLGVWTHDDLMFFTNRGRVFNTKVYDLPSVGRTAKGQAIVNIIQIAQDEKVTALIAISHKPSTENNKYFFMATQNGVVKKTLISAYQNVRKTGLIAIKLRPQDQLKWVVTTSGENEIMMVSKRGQGIHFSEANVRPMGRAASGVRGIKLRVGDTVIAMNVIKDPEAELLTVSERGLGKRTKITLFGIQNRGGFGMRAAKVAERGGQIIEALMITGNDGDVVMVSRQGQVIRMPLKSVKRLGRDTQGVTLMRLNKGDHVASMALLRKEAEEILPTPEIAKPQKIDIKEVKAVPETKPLDKDEKPKVEPKPVVNKPKPAKPFKPALRVKEKTEKKTLPGISKPKVSVKHYQGSQKKSEKGESNYWGGDLFKKKKI